jgi:hypothetical protein
MMTSIDQCIFATHTTSSVYKYDNTIFFDACETEILDAPVSLQDIVPKLQLNMNQISKDYGPSLVGCLLASFRKRLNILPSMHIFLWEL